MSTPSPNTVPLCAGKLLGRPLDHIESRFVVNTLTRCGYYVSNDRLVKLRQVVAFAAIIYERLVEIHGCYKNKRRMARIVTLHAGTWKQRDSAEIARDIRKAEDTLIADILATAASK